jgi:hypothetical protein
MGVGGLEPPTSALSELRSNQLIYTPGIPENSEPRILTDRFFDVQPDAVKSQRFTEHQKEIVPIRTTAPNELLIGFHRFSP